MLIIFLLFSYNSLDYDVNARKMTDQMDNMIDVRCENIQILSFLCFPHIIWMLKRQVFAQLKKPVYSINITCTCIILMNKTCFVYILKAIIDKLTPLHNIVLISWNHNVFKKYYNSKASLFIIVLCPIWLTK